MVQTLLDLNGAPWESTVKVLRKSKIPNGWVIIGTDRSPAADPKAPDDRFTLLCLNGAPKGALVKVLRTSENRIPSGWRAVPPPEGKAPAGGPPTGGGVVKTAPPSGMYHFIKKN
jgi:hypothetical protein